ncbi:L-fuculose-phosphate aldolase [Thermosyntropha lipolytica DSM 11003]|uniref:L-fuculose-phosphate aldolase n=1 Tax=Thermosyntropha lipolytica DSM 11003 TaxID=1123382 RepID=A0A1M5PJ23_9FIRM|nr:class II aldolase/adducin family protein [Thermosyntropha lipolytica]SHH01489.1 L-fuculose-phosphate aldolase [Thermosyntropha lipolytica DSM 11003]
MRYVEVRREVCMTAREIYEARLVAGTWGNVSAWVDDVMVITPSGMDYGTLSPEDMVIVNGEGEVIEGFFAPSVETPLHLAIYKNRPDVKGIVHVHSPYATAFAVARRPIPVILEETAQAIGHEIPVAPYAHCGSEELAHHVVRTLGQDKKAVLLANHGLITVDVSPSAALRACYIAERTAMITLFAEQIGSINILADEDVKCLYEKFKNYGQKKDR